MLLLEKKQNNRIQTKEITNTVGPTCACWRNKGSTNLTKVTAAFVIKRMLLFAITVEGGPRK